MKQKIIYSDILKTSWKSLISQCWLLIGLTIGFTIIYSFLLLFIIPSKGETISVSGFIVVVISFLLLALFGMGFLKNCLQTLDEEEPQFSAYGQIANKLFIFIVAYLIYSAIVSLGFSLFIVPGIYLGLRLQFFYVSMVDEDSGLIESFKRSWDITKGHTLRLFILFLIQLLICLIGMIIFGVGLFIAIPFITLTYGYAYRKLTAPTVE